MLTFEQYKTQRDYLESWCSDIGSELRAYPKNEMGMTIESIRMTDEYKAKKALFNKVFGQLRKLNGVYVKHYRRELMAERQSRFGGKNEKV
ncbi:protein of unknown function [Pseudotevenvirus RB43]|uniref:Uncharacterized protein n=2 Tax=Pseudotevenvirus RB43 TaxID=115991 RepID=Q56BM7_9CAUD|nr:hypothetical protein RB43ORF171c [Escherichia phage RB43]AAX78693.1 hypothetical protein RB43ORF171c [Escherichia phage RB43]CCK74016.1 protein of unknown function [Pseudotevenvirus RB43]CCL97633.1 protein of unknown function [Pseudotevenvirus RB43]